MIAVKIKVLSDLESQITEARANMERLAVLCDFDFKNCEVIQASEFLDGLLNEYEDSKRKGELTYGKRKTDGGCCNENTV